MGPLLWKDNPKLYFPGDESAAIVPDYYCSDYKGPRDDEPAYTDEKNGHKDDLGDKIDSSTHSKEDGGLMAESKHPGGLEASKSDKARAKDIAAVDQLPWAHPRRLWAMTRMVLTYGVTRDIIGHQSKGLDHVHARAPVFDNKVEHLWTTAQVCSAMIMSIAHGANDISNAIGPFTTEYETWSTGVASAKTDTPTWIKAVGGLGLGFGFWTFG